MGGVQGRLGVWRCGGWMRTRVHAWVDREWAYGVGLLFGNIPHVQGAGLTIWNSCQVLKALLRLLYQACWKRRCTAYIWQTVPELHAAHVGVAIRRLLSACWGAMVGPREFSKGRKDAASDFVYHSPQLSWLAHWRRATAHMLQQGWGLLCLT